MEFKEGQIVRFKTWEQMEQEFGLERGHINCYCYFTKPMKYLCGKEFKITNINGSDKKMLHGQYKDDDDGHWESVYYYTISTDMIKQNNINRRIIDK